MRKYYAFPLFVFIFWTTCLHAQQAPDSTFVVKGFAIAAPRPSGVDDFVKFINDELAPRKINTLILRIDYNYQYKSHPEFARLGGTVERRRKEDTGSLQKERHRHHPPN